MLLKEAKFSPAELTGSNTTYQTELASALQPTIYVTNHSW
jgi:hypothetical protein